MKLILVDLGGEETVVWSRTPKTTLGKFLQSHAKNIAGVEINDDFVEDWHSYKPKATDSIKLYNNVKDPVTIGLFALSILFSVLSYVLAPKPKKPNKNLSNQPALGVAGIQNTIAPGTPKILPYGRRRVFGHLITSKIGLVEPINGLANSGKKMDFSAMYFMGKGPLFDIKEVKINNTQIEDLAGPPGYHIRLGTTDQEIITGHELVYQTYQVNQELEIMLRAGSSKSILPTYGDPYIYTTKSSDVNRATLFLHFPIGYFAYGVHGAKYGNYLFAKVEYKENSGCDDWVETIYQFYTKTDDAFFWFIEQNFPRAAQWDIRISLLPGGHGSFQTGPTASLFNVMETQFITTTYPGSALLEVHGIASDQITGFEQMETSAIVCGRLVEVPINGIYVKQFSRNRVWITRDVLINKEVGLGNRVSPSLWDEAAGREAAAYYEETTLNFDGNQEQRDFCDVIINEARSGWDHIKTLTYEGRAALIPSDGKLKYVLDKDYSLLPDNYTKYSYPGNIIKDTLQLERNASPEKNINTIRGEFSDEEKDFKVIPTKLRYPGTETEPERPETISFTSITRKSQVSREMNFRLKQLREIQKRWSWKSPRSAIVSEPFDLGKLSYNTSKRLRGYNGFINNNAGTTSSIVTDREIYLAAGFTYTVHVKQGNTIEECTITNPLGNTYSILTLSPSLSFEPDIGDIWAVGKSSGQILPIQIDELEFDGENIIVKAHEHIPAVYVDTLTDVTAGENVSGVTVSPIPILGAQVYQFSAAGITTYQANVIPAFSSLIGTYSFIGTNSYILDDFEPEIDDLFNDAYLDADDQLQKILDYDGTTKRVTVAPTGSAGVTQDGAYSIFWSGFIPYYGFKLDYGPSASGPWVNIDSIAGTSHAVAASLLSGTVSHFRFTSIDSAGTEHISNIITTPGITDTTAPLPPVSVDITTDDLRQANLAILMNSPIGRDTHQLLGEFTLNSYNGTSITTSTLLDISSLRDELSINNRLTLTADLSTESFGSSIFGKVSAIDFYGNKSVAAISFTGSTLSGSDPDDPEEFNISESTENTAFSTLGTSHSVFSETIDGGTLGTINKIELDLLLKITTPATTDTTLSFAYKYGGQEAAILSTGNILGLTNGDPIWLNFLVEADGDTAQQEATSSLYYELGGLTNSVLGLGIDSTIDKTLAIEMSIVSGLSNTEITREYAVLKQIVP